MRSFIVGAVLAASVATAAPRTERRVVILAIDGLRPDHLKTYLSDPAYAGLRKQGFLADLLGPGRTRLSPEGLDRAIATFPSYTWPAWGTVFTGHFPDRHGVFGQTFLLRDGRGWSGRERGQFFNADRAFTDGPHAYGYDIDETGKKKIDALLKRVWRPLRSLARKGLGKIEDYLRGKVGERTFTLERVLAGLRSAGKSAVTEFLKVPTLYDAALEAGLKVHVVFQFYHPKSRNADDAETYSRPDKETLTRIGFGDKLGAKFAGSGLERVIRAVQQGLKTLGKADLLDPVVAPLRRSIEGPLLGDPALPDTFLNQVRGHIYHDQKAARVALDLVRRRRDIPHIFTLYQSGVDECSHKIAGDADRLPDVQARCLGFVDRNLKPVVDAIRRTPAWKDTLFILASDHGHTRGHRAADPKHRIAEAEIEEMLRIVGVGRCQAVHARSGHMANLYLMPNRRVLAAFSDEKECQRASGKEPLAFPGDRAAEAASALARRPQAIPRGIIGIFARKGGRYRIYFARRYAAGKEGSAQAYPEGMDLEAFAKSPAGRTVGFIALARRLEGTNDPDRSGDLIIVTDPEAKFSFSSSPGTHGGLLAEDSWAALTFFGPAADKAARGTVKLRRALQIDAAPSILRFLGVDPGKMSGRALFDEALKPVR
jgi:predicted AlkP superfamily pyrophosphatase or phosphodiesterase